MLPKFIQKPNPEIYLSDNYTSLDFETTNRDKGRATNPDNRIVCWVATDGTGERVHQEYYDREPAAHTRLLQLVDGSRVDFVVAHNAKFELQWLYRSGLEPGSILVWDTMIAEKVLLGNRKAALDLETVSLRYGLRPKESLVSTLISEGVCPSQIPRKRLLAYCKTDTELANELFLRQRTLILERGLLPVMLTRCLTTLVLAEIETRGMYVDRDATLKEYAETVGYTRRALAYLAQLTGGINPRSPKQVAAFLYDTLKFSELRLRDGKPNRTPTGGRRTDEATVGALTATTEPQQRFVEAFSRYQPLKKRLEILTKLRECANNEKILLASFNQCVVDTHRLSSSGHARKVQFQNVDRTLKRLFVPRYEGWSIGDSDAPQLEFRVAGAVSHDPQLALDVRKGFDVHRNTASILLNKPQSAVTKSERTDAKSHTFKPLYGGKSGTVAQKRYYAAFQKRYSVLAKVQEDWTYHVLANKQLRIPSGLIFYWPDVEVFESGYVKNTTKIYNYPIQSFATADIIPITLVYMWYMMRGMKSFIINTVHDSIISELAPGEEEEWKAIIKKAYTTCVFDYLRSVYNYEFSLPLGVSYNVGGYWGDGKEELFEVDPELLPRKTV